MILRAHSTNLIEGNDSLHIDFACFVQICITIAFLYSQWYDDDAFHQVILSTQPRRLL